MVANIANVFEKKEEEKTISLITRDLSDGQTDIEYTIREIQTDDSELRNFLFSLGCYEGEKVTLISILSGNFVISIKDSRYSIDKDLAQAIII